MKQIVILLVCTGIMTLYTTSSYAGGCCFSPLNVSKTGIAGKSPVIVSSRLSNPEYSPTKDIPKYRANEEIEVVIVDPKDGQRCDTPAYTDANGFIESACYSNTPDEMQVFMMTPNLTHENGEIIKSPIKTFYFGDPSNYDDEPTVTPEPSPRVNISPTPTTKSNNPDVDTILDKIDELETKVDQQEKRISVLGSVVERITQLFDSIFTSGRRK